MLSQFWGQDEFWQGTLVEKCSQVDGCEFSSSYFSPCFGPSEFEFSVPLSPACLCIPGDSPAFPGCPWQGSCPTPSWRSCSGATRAPRGGVMCAAVVSCPQSSLTALSLSAGISPVVTQVRITGSPCPVPDPCCPAVTLSQKGMGQLGWSIAMRTVRELKLLSTDPQGGLGGTLNHVPPIASGRDTSPRPGSCRPGPDWPWTFILG